MKQQGVWWGKAAQLRQAGSRVHMEGARRSCGTEEAMESGMEGQAGRQGCPDVEPASGERWEDVKNGIIQWMIETGCGCWGVGCGGHQWWSL